MSIRSRVFITGLFTLAAPFAAQANGADRAADACIQAFVETYVPKDKQVQVRKLLAVSGPTSLYSRRYTIDLSTRLTRDGDALTARCVASPEGRVITLD